MNLDLRFLFDRSLPTEGLLVTRWTLASDPGERRSDLGGMTSHAESIRLDFDDSEDWRSAVIHRMSIKNLGNPPLLFGGRFVAAKAPAASSATHPWLRREHRSSR